MSDRPRFSVGEEVIDTDADEPGRMLVLDPNRGRAREVHIAALEKSVAAVNPNYPPDERVVECIHVEWLERNAGNQWTTWPRDEFPQRLREYTKEWSLSPRTYDYPEARLEQTKPADRPDDPSSSVREAGTQSSMDEWL